MMKSLFVLTMLACFCVVYKDQITKWWQQLLARFPFFHIDAMVVAMLVVAVAWI